MIEKMHKYTFLVYHRQYSGFLKQLQEVGVLHVKERPEGMEENDALREKMQLASQVDKVIAELEVLLTPDQRPLATDGDKDGGALLAEYAAMQDERRKLQTAVDQTTREAERMAVWGTFSSDTLKRLADQGFVLQYYSCPKSRFDEAWEREKNAYIVGEVNSVAYLVAVNREPVDIEADMVTLNERNSVQLYQDVENLNGLLVAQTAKMQAWAVANLNCLKQYATDIKEGIAFDRVLLNTIPEADSKVMLLEGYCPMVAEDALLQLLEREHIYYEQVDPDIDDPDIPVKLKNGWFARLFEPITKLYALPGYSEIDPTAFFAPFFMLFFGLCLGDGGYGLLILIAATIARIKMPKYKSLATLGQFLGGATMLVGALTGVFFGVMLDSVAWPWLAGVKQYFLTANNYADKLGGYDPMMIFALGVGMFQILFAMGFKVAKITIQHGFKYALSTLGWLVALVCLLLAILLPVAGVVLPQAVSYALYGMACFCGLFIFFYNSPGKNIFLNFGSGLWDTYNMASGLLGDVLSYIRLFALGLAGGILGNVFNSLAMDLTAGLPPYIGWLPMLLILLVGHGLNFLLCIIGSVVHPLRLTFVEFYKNSGFDGGGTAYAPFRKTTEE